MPTIDIHALSQDRLPDWLHFFDHVAFADNPDWQDCYCHFLHVDKAVKPWDQWTGAENRRAVIPLIEQRQMNGMLAYADGAVIGWCHAGPSRCLTAMQSEADAHFGPLSLYLSEGFSVWRDQPGERLLTVRKLL